VISPPLEGDENIFEFPIVHNLYILNLAFIDPILHVLFTDFPLPLGVRDENIF
jgi:hypothetical protein